MLDGIEEFLRKSKILFVRIDGRTSNEKRYKNVKDF